MDFKTAITNAAMGTTHNGMPTNITSNDPAVDLFFMIGSSRGKNLVDHLALVIEQNLDEAMRILLWARDVRGGAGERSTFRSLLVALDQNAPSEIVEKIIKKVPEIGRWDDLFVIEQNRDAAFTLIAGALLSGDRLASKWSPRKGSNAEALRKFMNLTPKAYRKLIVSQTNVVETAMCAKNWDAIEFGKLPSIASSRYQKAFTKRCGERYSEYKEGLVKGTEKINAGAVYPYDVIKSLNHGDVTVATAQWDALPNFLGEDFNLPMVDVSGSMSCYVGGSTSLTCMDVAVSLGLYLADKQTGAFKDTVLTFTSKPTLQVLKGDLSRKLNQIMRADWGMSTNIEAAFAEVLKVALAGKVPANEMPKYITILSDMEFDYCAKSDQTAIDMIEQKYSAAGYDLPKIIFWQLNARAGNVPVKSGRAGAALISGFSPAIMKSVLAAQDFSPRQIMLDVIMNERYNWM